MGVNPTKVLIAAGVHPEEEAGVLYLQAVDKYSDWGDNVDVSIIPCRNTYGFNISEHLSFDGVFRKCRFGDFIMSDGRLFLIPNLSFLRDHRDVDFVDLVKSFFKQEPFDGFLDILSLRNGSQMHANSFYVHNGFFWDLNSRSGVVDHVFVHSTNNMLAAYAPDCFIDLHESIGNECFIYVSRSNSRAIGLAVSIVESMKGKGVPFRNAAKDRERLHEGLFALESFSDYHGDPEDRRIEMVFETGIDSPVNVRLSWISLFLNSFFNSLSASEL